MPSSGSNERPSACQRQRTQLSWASSSFSVKIAVAGRGLGELGDFALDADLGEPLLEEVPDCSGQAADRPDAGFGKLGHGEGREENAG
jgi:hypothetical protein